MKNLVIAAAVLSLATPLAGQTQTPAPPAAAASASASSMAADVSGTWDATFNTQNGQIPAQIKLSKNAGKLTGTISSQMGESTVEAQQKDKAISMWFTMQGQNGPLPIELAATLEGDTLKGTATAAGSPAGDWTATRAKAAPSTDAKPQDTTSSRTTTTTSTTTTSSPALLSGNWSLTLELPNMTANPSLALKQDGEKLSGEYISTQYGKFPITGTVKGTDVTFSFPMSVEGTALNVTYTGKIAKDGTLAGTVAYGDMMSGNFTASRVK